MLICNVPIVLKNRNKNVDIDRVEQLKKKLINTLLGYAKKSFGISMKAVLKTLILFGLVQVCYANPIGKVPAEQKRYVFPKRAVKVEQPSSDPFKNTEELTAYAEEEVYNEKNKTSPIAQKRAENKTPQKPAKKKKPYKPFKIDVAPQYSYMIVRSPGMRKNKGNLWGISGEMEYKKNDHIYGEASFLWYEGDLKPPHSHKHNWKEGIAQAMIGYTTPIFYRTMMTFCAGFGYRRVLDHKGYAGFHPRAALNYYQYFIPVGLLFDFNYLNHFSFSLNLKAMPSVDSRVQVSNHPGIFWELSDKMSYEVDLPITWKAVRGIVADFDIALVPFFKYWQLGGSSRLGLHCRAQTYWGAELLLGLGF